MANEEVIVEARPGASPVEEEVKAPSGGVDLPDDLLKLPAVQGLVSGSPGAFSANLAALEKSPEAKLLVSNKDALIKAGMGLYRSMDGATGVVFNQLFHSPDEVKAADAAGQIQAIAPPFEQLNMEIGKSGANNPVLAEGERPTGFKTGASAQPPGPVGLASPKPPAAGVQKSLANARSKNIQPGSPTSGPKPGSGRLLNSILKNVV